MLVSFKRITQFGWQGFSRNKSLTAQVIFIMMVAVFVVTFLFLFKQVSVFLIEETQAKVDISVYFKKDTTEDKILELKEQLVNFSEKIEAVSYTSSEEAYEVFIQGHNSDSFFLDALEQVDGNPFLASLDIKATSPEQYSYVASFLEENVFSDLVEKVSYNQSKGVIDKLFEITSNIELAGMALSVFFALLVVLVTFNTIRLSITSSKRELSTRRLVGASNWFIRGPFLVQSALYAIFAVIIFDAIFLAVALFLNSQLKALLLDFNLLRYLQSNFLVLLLMQIVFCLVLATASSWLAVRKYLKI